MTIYGVSQSTGVQQRLRVERGGEGVVLTLLDHPGDTERERILLPPDGLLAAVTGVTPGPSTLEGRSPPHGDDKLLDVEVRRNEVLLCVRAGTGDGCDVAVGLDDFQDALEKVIG